MDKFANPKLEKLFEALAELYPTSMGWGTGAKKTLRS